MAGFKENVCVRSCSALGRKLRQEILLVLMMIGVVVGFIISVSVNGSVNAIENPEDKKKTLMRYRRKLFFRFYHIPYFSTSS